MKFSLRHPWLISQLLFRGCKIFFQEGYFKKEVSGQWADLRDQLQHPRQTVRNVSDQLRNAWLRYQAWRQGKPFAGVIAPMPEKGTRTTAALAQRVPQAQPKEVNVEKMLLNFAEARVYPAKMAEEELLKVMFFHLVESDTPFVSGEQKTMLQHMKNLYWQGEILGAKDRVKQRLLGKEREMGRLRFLMPTSEDLTSQVLVRRILDYGPEKLMQDIQAGRLEPSVASQVWEFLESYRRVLLNPDLADSFARAQKIAGDYERDAWTRLFPFLQFMHERMLQEKLTAEEEKIVDYLAELARCRLADDRVGEETEYAQSLRDLFRGVRGVSTASVSEQAVEQAGQRLSVLQGYSEAENQGDTKGKMEKMMEWVRQAPTPMRLAMAVCLGAHAGWALGNGVGGAMLLSYELLHPDTAPHPADLHAAFNGFDAMKDLVAKNLQEGKKRMQTTGEAVSENMRKAVQKERVDIAVQKAKEMLKKDAPQGPSAEIQKAVKEFLEKSGVKTAPKKEVPVQSVDDVHRLTALRTMFGDMLGQAKGLFDKDIAAGRYKGKVADEKLREFSGWIGKAYAEAGKIFDAMVDRMAPAEKARFLENQVMPVHSFQAWGSGKNIPDELTGADNPTHKHIGFNLNGAFTTYENFLSVLIHAHFHSDIQKPDGGGRLAEGVDQLYVKGVLSLLGSDYHDDAAYTPFVAVAGLLWNEDRDALLAWTMGKMSGDDFANLLGKKIFSRAPPEVGQKIKDFLRGKAWDASGFVKLVGPYVNTENLKSNPGKIDLTHRMLLAEFLIKEGFIQGPQIYSLLVEGFAPALKDKLAQGQKLSPSTVNMFFHLLSLAAQGRNAQELAVLRSLAEDIVRKGATPPPDFDMRTLAVNANSQTVQSTEQPEENAAALQTVLQSLGTKAQEKGASDAGKLIRQLQQASKGPGSVQQGVPSRGKEISPAATKKALGTLMEMAKQKGPGAESLIRDLLGPAGPPELNAADMAQQLGQLGKEQGDFGDKPIDLEQENRMQQTAINPLSKNQEEPPVQGRDSLDSPYGAKVRQPGSRKRASDEDLHHFVERLQQDMLHAGESVMNTMDAGKGVDQGAQEQMTQEALNLVAEGAVERMEALIQGGDAADSSREIRALLEGLTRLSAFSWGTHKNIFLSSDMIERINTALWAAISQEERLGVLKHGNDLDWSKHLHLLMNNELTPLRAKLAEVAPEDRRAIVEPLITRAVAQCIAQAEQFVKSGDWNMTRFLDLLMGVHNSVRYDLADAVYGFKDASWKIKGSMQSMPHQLFRKALQENMHGYSIRGKDSKSIQEVLEAVGSMDLDESIVGDFLLAQLSQGADIADLRDVYSLLYILEKFKDAPRMEVILQKAIESLIKAMDEKCWEEIGREKAGHPPERPLLYEFLQISDDAKLSPLFAARYWAALHAWAQKLPVTKRVPILTRLDHWYRSYYHDKKSAQELEKAFRNNYEILMESSIPEVTDPWDFFCLYDLAMKPPDGISALPYRTLIETKLDFGEISVDLASATNFFVQIFDQCDRPSEIPNNPLSMDPSNLLPGFLTPEVWKKMEPLIEKIPWDQVCTFDAQSKGVGSWLEQYSLKEEGLRRFRHPFMKLEPSKASVLTQAIAKQLINDITIKDGLSLIPPSERSPNSLTQHDCHVAMKNAFDLLVVLLDHDVPGNVDPHLGIQVMDLYLAFLQHSPEYPDFSSLASGFPLRYPGLVAKVLPGWRTMFEKAPANPNMKAVVLTSLAKFPKGSEQVAGSLALLADRAMEAMSVDDFLWVFSEVHRWMKAADVFAIADEKRLAVFMRAAVRKINACTVPAETPSDRFIAGNPREVAINKVNALIGCLPTLAAAVRDTRQKIEIATILAGVDSSIFEKKGIVLENKVVRKWLQYLSSTRLDSRPDVVQKITSMLDANLHRLLDVFPLYRRESFTEDLPRVQDVLFGTGSIPHDLLLRMISKLAEIAQNKSYLEDCGRGESDQVDLAFYLMENARFASSNDNTPQAQEMVAKTVAAVLLLKFKGPEPEQNAREFIQQALSKNIPPETLLKAMAKLDYRWHYNADLGAKVMDHLLSRLEAKTLSEEEVYALSRLIWLMKDKARAMTLLQKGLEVCKNAPGWEQRFMQLAKLDQLAIRIDEIGASNEVDQAIAQRIRQRSLLGSPILDEIIGGLPDSFKQGAGKAVIDALRKADMQLLLESLGTKDLQLAQDPVKAIKNHWEQVSKGFLEKFKDKPPTLAETREMMNLMFRFPEGFKAASLSMAEERALAVELAKSAADFITLMDPAKRIELVLGYFRPEFKDNDRNRPIPGTGYMDILMAKSAPESTLQRQYALALLGCVASSVLGDQQGEYKAMGYDELLAKLLDFQKHSVELDGFAAGIVPVVMQEVETAPMESWKRNVLRIKLFSCVVHFDKGRSALEMLKNWPQDFSLQGISEELLVKTLSEFEDAKRELFDHVHGMGVLSSVLPRMEAARAGEHEAGRAQEMKTAIDDIRSKVALIREVFNSIPQMYVEDQRHEARPADYDDKRPSAVPSDRARVEAERDFLKHFNDVMGAKISGAKVAKDWSPIGTRLAGRQEKKLGPVSRNWAKSPVGDLSGIRRELWKEFPALRPQLRGSGAARLEIWDGMQRLGQNMRNGNIRIDKANFKFSLDGRTVQNDILPVLTILHELLHEKIRSGNPDIDEVAIETIVLGYLFQKYPDRVDGLLAFLKNSPLIQHKKYAKMIKRLRQWGPQMSFSALSIRRIAQTVLHRDLDAHFIERIVRTLSEFMPDMLLKEVHAPPGREFSERERAWLVQYVKEYLQVHQDVVRQNNNELLESLLDPARLEIALYPLSSDIAAIHAFSAVQQDFLNKLPRAMLLKIFARKVQHPSFQAMLEDFIAQMSRHPDRLSETERKFVEAFRQDGQDIAKIAITGFKDFSSARGFYAEQVVYRLKFSVGGESMALFMKGEPARSGRLKEERTKKREEFYMRYLNIAEQLSVLAKYFPRPDGIMTGIVLSQEFPGVETKVLFDEKGRLKQEYREFSEPLLQELARSAAAADLVGRCDRKLIQRERPEYAANFMVLPGRLTKGLACVLPIDNEFLFAPLDMAVIRANRKSPESEIGFIGMLPEFHQSEEGRYALLARFIERYLQERRNILQKKDAVEQLISEMFGSDSTEMRMFHQLAQADPVELLTTLSRDLFKYYGYDFDAARIKELPLTDGRTIYWPRPVVAAHKIESLDQARRAITSGARMLEVDAQVTKDGRIIAWHGKIKTGAADVCVYELTKAEIETALGQEVLDFEDLLPLMETNRVALDLDPKDWARDIPGYTQAFVQKMLDLIKKYHMEGQILAGAFNDYPLLLKRALPSIVAATYAAGRSDLDEWLNQNAQNIKAAGSQAVGTYGPKLTQELVDKIHREGLLVITGWKDLDPVLAMQVDLIWADDYEDALAFVARQRKGQPPATGSEGLQKETSETKRLEEAA